MLAWPFNPTAQPVCRRIRWEAAGGTCTQGRNSLCRRVAFRSRGIGSLIQAPGCTAFSALPAVITGATIHEHPARAANVCFRPKCDISGRSVFSPRQTLSRVRFPPDLPLGSPGPVSPRVRSDAERIGKAGASPIGANPLLPLRPSTRKPCCQSSGDIPGDPVDAKEYDCSQASNGRRSNWRHRALPGRCRRNRRM